MDLANITPLVLTYNEAPNIEACLESLRWAKEVVVLDSLSQDDTASLAKRYPNVRLVQRAFDSHAAQWNFGLLQTAIRTEWVLSMDADYRVTPSLLEEIREVGPGDSVSAYKVPFRYCVYGTPLTGSLYPPRLALFRKEACRYFQSGHTQRLEVVEGAVASLRERMLHDDWKSLGRWLASQSRYMDLEAEKLLGASPGELSFKDRLRAAVFPAPFISFIYVLLIKGVILDGWPGWQYALQRLTAEIVLSMKLIEKRFVGGKGGRGEATSRRAGVASL